MLFDAISYSVDNDVSVEIIPLGPDEGIRIRIRDLSKAAQESTVIRWRDLQGIVRKDAYIEERCDKLLAMIGKRKRAADEAGRMSALMREREDFFRNR